MSTAFSLQGQRILITGAASGIGAAAARACALLGAEVALLDLPGCETVAATIAADGVARSFEADVADRAAIEKIVAGLGRVDGMVASAALCPWEDWLDPGWDESFARVMDVNLLGPIHCARALLPGMIERRHGRIVLVGSVAGRIGGLIAGPHYVASKGGLHALVKWLAKKGGPHNVLVNGVAPASVETGMMRGQPVDLSRVPLGRMARPDEVAWPIAFLCSAAASYICGTVVDVNGGVYMN